MEKNLFYCASKEQTYEGYTKVLPSGRTTPLFDKYTSEKIFNDLVNISKKSNPNLYKWFYNSHYDTFIFITNNDECEVFKGEYYEVGDELIHLYEIGDEWDWFIKGQNKYNGIEFLVKICKECDIPIKKNLKDTLFELLISAEPTNKNKKKALNIYEEWLLSQNKDN
ncbi:hypothetical protein [uncultured Clostridium sp.]|uniref:hypothetical protein n=1 Tax=uncultured Clostridium sp. TaxID=59620 RepID=UPI00272CE1CA|nr:hypothetical protein [uncultured Clostridium sp.]